MAVGNVRVRPATPGDTAAIRDIYAPIVRDTTISFEADPPGADEILRRMRAGIVPLPWLVAETPQGIAGFAAVGVFPAAGYKHGRWVDVGWWTLALRVAPVEPAPPLAWPPGKA